MKTITNIVKKLFGRDVSTSDKLNAGVAEIEGLLVAARAARAELIGGELADADAGEQVAKCDAKIRLLTERAEGLRSKFLDLKISELEAQHADLRGQINALAIRQHAEQEAFVLEITKLTPRGQQKSSARDLIMRGQLETPSLKSLRFQRAELSKRVGDVGGQLHDLTVERERRAATVPGQVGVRLS